MLKKFGVETTYYDPPIGAGIASAAAAEHDGRLHGSARLAIVRDAGHSGHRRGGASAGAVVLMDNTWATPLFFPPHERGVDIAIEAGTKYLSGGSDLLLGMVSANERCFKTLRDTYDAFAMCPGPEDVFLGLRGLRTMALRLREHEKQALDMARWLAARPEVARVLHPALESYPGHAIWKRDFKGSSGLFSVVLKPCSDQALAACSMVLALSGWAIPGAGSRASSCRSTARPTAPRRDGSPAGSLRFHIGLEDLDDLKRDLDAGFARLREADIQAA